MPLFVYNSVQSKQTRINGKIHCTTRRVQIKNGKGFKEVVTRTGRTTRRSRKALSRKELRCIERHKFIPGLFESCLTGMKKME